MKLIIRSESVQVIPCLRPHHLQRTPIHRTDQTCRRRRLPSDRPDLTSESIPETEAAEESPCIRHRARQSSACRTITIRLDVTTAAVVLPRQALLGFT